MTREAPDEVGKSRRRTLLACAAIPFVDRVWALESRPRLQAELRRIADTVGGRMGVAALGVDGGERVRFESSARYPMASTVKVAVALSLLHQVDRRALALSESIEIRAGDLSPGSGEINKSMVDAGSPSRASTLGQLLEEMLVVSDNTATDHLIDRIGGPQAVMTRLRELHVDGIDVSRSMAQGVADLWGFKLPPPGQRDRKSLVRLHQRTTPAARQQAAAKFLDDPRDMATPDAMVELLEVLVTGKALGNENTKLLLDTMRRCKTGRNRIRGQLPRDMAVAHKTGTFTGVTTNDVGILNLPGGRGPLIVAIYLTASPRSMADQERAIASTAVELYRHHKHG